MSEEQNLPEQLLEDDFASLKIKKEIEKLDAEISKVKNENKKGTRTWSKIRTWVSALSPIIVGLCTLYVVKTSGLLQAQAKINELQEKTFINRKVEIDKHIDSLNNKISLDSLKNIAITKSTDSLNKILMFSKKLLEKFRNENKNISDTAFLLFKELAIANLKNNNFNQTVIDLNETIKKNKQDFKMTEMSIRDQCSRQGQRFINEFSRERQSLEAEIKRLKDELQQALDNKK